MKRFNLTSVLVCSLLAKTEAFLRLCTTHISSAPTFVHNVELQLSAGAARDENQQAAIFAKEKQSQRTDGQEWRNAVIVSSVQACSSGKSTVAEIKVDELTMREYTTPGQFIQLRPDDDMITDPIFLAISSAPVCCKSSSIDTTEPSSTFQFLIKMSPRLPWLPETLVPGKVVKISPVMGKGFPLEKLSHDTSCEKPSTVLLLAAGSGIAPLKACIESGLLSCTSSNDSSSNNNPIPSQTILYYGEWSPDDLCFTNLYDNWKEKHNTIIKPVFSRTPDSRGYIQNVLSRHKNDDDGLLSADTDTAKSTWVILCGMDEMVESCKKVMLDKGVEEDHILLNF